MKRRIRLAFLLLVAHVTCWPSFASAQLSIELACDASVTPGRAEILAPVWIFWRAPDGSVSRPCGSLPVRDTVCSASPHAFDEGRYRLDVVEVVGNRSHTFEIPTDGREAEIEIVVRQGRATARLYRPARGVVLRQELEAVSMVNGSGETYSVATVGGAAVAYVEAFSLLGWRRRLVMDFEGALGEVTIAPGGRLPVRIEPSMRAVPSSLHRARVRGPWEEWRGPNVLVRRAWVSEPLLFHGSGLSRSMFRP